MMRVVKYYDLRPVDWASGKRLPLSPGEGHICDRCGAEHAVVYVVEDVDTGTTYSVGSSCSRATFGFDVSKDDDAKKLVKASKKQAAAELDAARQQMVESSAALLATEVSNLPLPPLIADTTSYKNVTCWRCGDSPALAQSRTDAETQKVAVQGWIANRLRERIPQEWEKIEILYNPNSQSTTKILMSCKVQKLAQAKILDLLERQSWH